MTAPFSLHQVEPVAPASVRRILVARCLAWLFAVVAAVPMMGLVDLATVFGLSDPQFDWAMSLEASWGSLFTFLIAGAFGWIGSRPAQSWSGLALLGILVVALLLSSLVLLDPGPAWVALALAGATAAIYLLAPPGPPHARQSGRHGWRSVWAFVVAVGVPLWLAYSWFAYAAATSGVEGDITNGVEHWPVQFALGVSLAAGAALLVARRYDAMLWRMSFALSAGIVAYASLAYPDRAGAMPHWLWAAGIATWAVAVLLPPERSRTGAPAEDAALSR